MKINQILDEYSVTDPEIIKNLKDRGYTYLKSGVDQSAFLEPGGKTVLKIFGTQDYATAPKKKTDTPVFSDDHKMFFRWAKYCNKHSNNPFLPKFSGFESFYWKGQVYLQIRQERMYPLKTMLEYMMADMADCASIGQSFNDMMYIVNDGYYDTELRNLKHQVGMPGVKLLYKTIDKLTKIGERKGWTQDLHGGNFLSRTRDGKFPVIVDPWVT